MSGSEPSREPAPGAPPPDTPAPDESILAPGRGTWRSPAGFVLAAVGSAVGLGNMWRFPATASSSGGGAFVALYVLLTFAVGIPLLLSEMALGRRTRLSPIGALRGAAGPRWALVGWLFVVSGFVIFSFYSVIAGWAVRYGVEALLTGVPASPGDHFLTIATGGGAVVYHVLFVAVTVGVVMAGVSRGIERAALVLMPTLFVLLAGFAVWAALLPGSGEGYAFYLAPTFEELLDPRTFADAAGQTYFSLSLGMGAILTFASYLGRDQNLGGEGTIIALSDFAVAFVAGLVVFPVVFSLGFADQVVGLTADEAEGVLFIALPGAFQLMGAFGRALAVLFFAALAVAALTSTLSLLEVVVSSVIDELGVSRRRAAVTVGAGIALLGIAPALSLRVLGLMNDIAGEIFLGLGAFLITIVVGWVMADPVAELEKGAGPRFRALLPAWYFVVRWILPPVTLGVLISMVAQM